MCLPLSLLLLSLQTFPELVPHLRDCVRLLEKVYMVPLNLPPSVNEVCIFLTGLALKIALAEFILTGSGWHVKLYILVEFILTGLACKIVLVEFILTGSGWHVKLYILVEFILTGLGCKIVLVEFILTGLVRKIVLVKEN